MALKIETFSNHTGGNALYKALSHPKTFRKIQNLLKEIGQEEVAFYDPLGILDATLEFYGTSFKALNIKNIFVQDFDDIGKTYPSLNGLLAEPLTELDHSSAKVLFILAFGKDLLLRALAPHLPKTIKIYSFDDVRIEGLEKETPYLTPLNFATNFAFFREQDGFHTQLVTANYWHRYGGKNLYLSCILFGEDGTILAEWDHPLEPSEHTITIDSRQIKRKFNLAPFTGQLFFHVIGARGHDIVKYALNTFNDDGSNISCTHDANSWPADSYAGLPAPHENEEVYLWIQNNHPVPIPKNTIGLNLMGKEDVSWLKQEVPPYSTYRLNVSDLLPTAKWPQQIEIHTGKYMVRPRYEVVCKTTKQQRIAHVNVQRKDLKQDISIAKLKPLFGKSYILPAPILPQDTFQSIALPTSMSTTQMQLPLKVFVYDATGKTIAEKSLGILSRDHSTVIDCKEWSLPSGFGHMEIAYEGDHNIPVDGWLHGLFRYGRGHNKAETSFGAHIFNTPLVYKNEPQSYAGAPPGLRTRLFLALSDGEEDTTCFLIYPSSTSWHPFSKTDFILHNSQGQEISRYHAEIPCSGSHLFSYQQTFSKALQTQAKGGYIIIRDTTCRLFGYHGTWGKQAFSLDHMFGF